MSRARLAGLVAFAALAFGCAPALGAADWTTAVKSMPGVRIPKVIVTARDDSVAPGFIFVTPRTIYPGRTGPTILDKDGHVVWFHLQSKRLSAQNLEPQTLEGQPVLTWSVRPPTVPEGDPLAGGSRYAYNIIANQNYHVVKRVRAHGRGVITDGHEFVITAQNTALVLGGRYVPKDLSHWGGPRRSGYIDDLVQEIDLRTNKLLFSWAIGRHVPLDESMVKPPSKGPWDPYHLNSISVDLDGNLLVSSRHTSTIYKLDRRTGRIIWRLGGKRSDFKIGRGADFWYQHDAKRQPDGTITLFDNGETDLDKTHANESVAKRLKLDMKAMTASLLRTFKHPAGTGVATSQGNVNILSNGDAFVGWGISPWFSEYAPDGRLLFGAHFTSVWHHSYRAFKAPWSGRPSGSPALYARVSAGRVAVYVSWNGATDVANWRLLGGPDQSSLTELVTQPWADFETRLAAHATPAFVQVQALDAAGNVLGSSPVVAPKTS